MGKTIEARKTIDALKEMMTVWNHIELDVKESFPNATKEEVYFICKSVMDKQLNLQGSGKNVLLSSVK